MCNRLEYCEATREHLLSGIINTFQLVSSGNMLDYQPCFFAMLRRSNIEKDDKVSLVFNLVDLDGRPAGKPRNWVIEGLIPSRFRFGTLFGRVPLQFPKAGHYRLDISTSGSDPALLYSYDVDLVTTPHS